MPYGWGELSRVVLVFFLQDMGMLSPMLSHFTLLLVVFALVTDFHLDWGRR